MPILFHGTLRDAVPDILEGGIRKGEGWGGAGTSGVFLSGTPEGALYWAKLAYQRAHEEKLEVVRFDRAHGSEINRLLAVLTVEIPDHETDRLFADEEQFEDVRANFDPADWEQSLEAIGDVRFEGKIPPDWIKDVIRPTDIQSP